MSQSIPDLDAASPEEVVAIARKLDDPAIKEVMAGPDRSRVLEVMVEQMASTYRADKGGDLDAVLHVKVWDKPGGGYDHYEIVIRDGVARRSHEPQEQPDLTLKASPADLLKVVTGRAGARMMAIRGKLRVQGDLKLGMRLPELFDI